MPAVLPALHKPIPMGSRVVIPDHYLKEKGVTGTVAGISSTHILFTYIVILDREVETEYGPMKAIVVGGPELRGVNGEDWRFPEPQETS